MSSFFSITKSSNSIENITELFSIFDSYLIIKVQGSIFLVVILIFSGGGDELVSTGMRKEFVLINTDTMSFESTSSK